MLLIVTNRIIIDTAGSFKAEQSDHNVGGVTVHRVVVTNTGMTSTTIEDPDDTFWNNLTALVPVPTPPAP